MYAFAGNGNNKNKSKKSKKKYTYLQAYVSDGRSFETMRNFQITTAAAAAVATTRFCVRGET